MRKSIHGEERSEVGLLNTFQYIETKETKIPRESEVKENVS